MSQYKYSIITDSEDPRQKIIRKENVVVDFTLAQLESDKKSVEKIKSQLVAQLQIDEAQLKNVENNHPYVLEATEEEKKKAVAIALHNGLANKIKETKTKIEEIDVVFKEHEDEMRDITEQTGLDLNDSPVIEGSQPSPYV